MARTIESIETNLLNAVAAGNMGRITTIINSLTLGEKNTISVETYDRVLTGIAEYGLSSAGAVADQQVASTLRNFMVKVGNYCDVQAIGFAMTMLADDANFKALDALTDNLTPHQKFNIPVQSIGHTLSRIAEHSLSAPDHLSNDETATVLRDFMSKLGQLAEPADIGFAMTMLADDANFKAIDALTDFLTTHQKFNIPVQSIGHTISRIAEYTFSAPDHLSNDETATVLRDFMSKLGQLAEPADIGFALKMLADDANFKAIDALTDFLTSHQKFNIPVESVGHTISRIAEYTFAAPDHLSNDETARVLRDFMSKLGQLAEPADIGFAMTMLVDDANFKALDALTDFLTSHQKFNIPVESVDHALSQIADYTFSAPDHWSNAETTDVLRNFMGKLGVVASQTAVEHATTILLHDGNIDAVGAVLDNVSVATAQSVVAATQHLLADNLVKVLSAANNVHQGSAAGESILGLGGNDTLYGNGGDDALYGGNGNDVLYGNSGHDRLIGGAGADSLRGGIGADDFVFDRVGPNADTVHDFKLAEGDRLDFSSILSNYDPVDDAITDFITKTTVNGNTTLSVDVDGQGAGVAHAVVTLEGVGNIDIEALVNNGRIIV